MTKTNDQFPRIEWHEVEGNPFNKGFNPLMIHTDGLIEFRQTRHKNADRKAAPKQFYEIRYGRDYVISFIVTKIISRLAFKDYREFNSFMSECWQSYQELNGKSPRKRKQKTANGINADKVT